jgi:hypothetical protein
MSIILQPFAIWTFYFFWTFVQLMRTCKFKNPVVPWVLVLLWLCVCQLFYNHLPVPNQYMDFQGLIVMFNEVFMLLIIGGICSNIAVSFIVWRHQTTWRISVNYCKMAFKTLWGSIEDTSAWKEYNSLYKQWNWQLWHIWKFVEINEENLSVEMSIILQPFACPKSVHGFPGINCYVQWGVQVIDNWLQLMRTCKFKNPVVPWVLVLLWLCVLFLHLWIVFF